MFKQSLDLSKSFTQTDFWKNRKLDFGRTRDRNPQLVK